jgi:apolipoprotein N-acyltransferase
VAGKRHLAPGGETMLGLERLALVRDYIHEVAGYVPDFLAAERTGLLELETRAGRRYRFGATSCFDNAFPQAYAEPLTRAALDFHLVVSNEAWYLESPEMDQMIAFSRLEALATGRALVRATNAGISAVLGPDGRELARLTVDGEDKLVTGTLAVTVPVPAEEGARRPPFVFTWAWWNAAAMLLPALLALLAGRRAVTSAGEGGSPGPRHGAPERA